MTAPFSIFYDDGSVWRSWTDGDWQDAPAEGVQVVMLYHGGEYKTIIQGEDVFLIDGESAEKSGRWMRDDDYAALVEQALASSGPEV
jgi:hypothetical protein